MNLYERIFRIGYPTKRLITVDRLMSEELLAGRGMRFEIMGEPPDNPRIKVWRKQEIAKIQRVDSELEEENMEREVVIEDLKENDQVYICGKEGLFIGKQIICRNRINNSSVMFFWHS